MKYQTSSGHTVNCIWSFFRSHRIPFPCVIYSNLKVASTATAATAATALLWLHNIASALRFASILTFNLVARIAIVCTLIALHGPCKFWNECWLSSSRPDDPVEPWGRSGGVRRSGTVRGGVRRCALTLDWSTGSIVSKTPALVCSENRMCALLAHWGNKLCACDLSNPPCYVTWRQVVWVEQEGPQSSWKCVMRDTGTKGQFGFRVVYDWLQFYNLLAVFIDLPCWNNLLDVNSGPDGDIVTDWVTCQCISFIIHITYINYRMKFYWFWSHRQLKVYLFWLVMIL